MNIDWDSERGEREALRESLSFDLYEPGPCKKCGRERVGKRKNGKHICEKCCWDQDANNYDESALNYEIGS